MNALEKYAAKKTLIKGLRKLKIFGKKVRGDYVKQTRKAARDAKGAKAEYKAEYSAERAKASQTKARKQVGFAGLAGLAALGIGAKVVTKKTTKKTLVKGTQSAAKRLSQFARKNKRALAAGGGAVGGAAALGAILKDKKK